MTPADLVITDEIISLIDLALKEDVAGGDVTSEAIFPAGQISESRIIAKDTGILCGLPVAREVYRRIEPSIEMNITKNDGEEVKPGDEVVRFTGPTTALLTGERTLLNFMQRLSGIATMTARLMNKLEGTEIKILDTRKTLPGFRLLDKYAVRAGGGQNHRMGLYDMVMIKDNHIKAAGSITAAVNRIREKWNNQFKVEVETTSHEEVREAVMAGADIIMLDNMTTPAMEEAVEIIDSRAEIEISGNVDEKRLEEIRHIKIDYISVGALTHSVRAFDLSMKFSDY